MRASICGVTFRCARFGQTLFFIGYPERRIFMAILGILLAVVFLYFAVEVLLVSSLIADTANPLGANNATRLNS